jgi:hypothetical protein
MNTWRSRGGATAVVALLVAGCGTSVASPTPRPTPSPTPRPTPSPTLVCTADGVQTEVRRLLAGLTFDTHYLTINGQLTLSIWVVDPAIDPAATAGTLAANNHEALGRGLSVAYQVIHEVPCTRRVFENINPMVVDGRYQSWYLDVVPIRAFEDLVNPSPDDLVTALEGGRTLSAIRRRVPPPQKLQTAAPGACTWPQARAALATRLDPPAGNTAAYLIIGGSLVPREGRPGITTEDVGVELQWVIHTPADDNDQAIRDRLNRLAQALACLAPPLDSLEAFVVDETGKLVVYATVPGALISAGAFPLPANRVKLYRTFLSPSPAA